MNNYIIASILGLLSLFFAIWFLIGARNSSKKLVYKKESAFKRMERESGV